MKSPQITLRLIAKDQKLFTQGWGIYLKGVPFTNLHKDLAWATMFERRSILKTPVSTEWLIRQWNSYWIQLCCTYSGRKPDSLYMQLNHADNWPCEIVKWAAHTGGRFEPCFYEGLGKGSDICQGRCALAGTSIHLWMPTLIYRLHPFTIFVQTVLWERNTRP